ncbi:MAG TPA: MFS transporter [Vicinamibacterales bacterium]
MSIVSRTSNSESRPPDFESRIPNPESRLFTPRFFLMCGFNFSVFLAAFQLFPTAPFRILALGGTEATAGLFLGFMTYASAVAAPFTGALADRVGKRHVLVVSSLAAALFSATYAVTTSIAVMLSLVAVHGVFWSALLTASGAYLADIIPAHRRAEGMGYYGLSTMLAIAIAPSIGLGVYRLGWPAVCLSALILDVTMAVIAYRLPDDRTAAVQHGPFTLRRALEWRVMAVAITMFLYAFGYGGITSFAALYATSNGVSPAGIYFMVFAATSMTAGVVTGPLGDRIGHTRLLAPALLLIATGYSLLAAGGTRGLLVASAIVFGVGFRSAYQFFTAHVLHHVQPSRRGAAFGGILAALDTGIGSGSIVMGGIIDRYGFRHAYATAACLALAAIPYFYVVSRIVWSSDFRLKPEAT